MKAPTDAELYDVACDYDECKTYQDILNFGRRVLQRWGASALPATPERTAQNQRALREHRAMARRWHAMAVSMGFDGIEPALEWAAERKRVDAVHGIRPATPIPQAKG